MPRSALQQGEPVLEVILPAGAGILRRHARHAREPEFLHHSAWNPLERHACMEPDAERRASLAGRHIPKQHPEIAAGGLEGFRACRAAAAATTSLGTRTPRGI